ncbi:MAG: tetratricopeptide repeat protein [Bacteroidota bacterium]
MALSFETTVRLEPILLGDEAADLGGFQAIDQHLMSDLQQDELRDLEGDLRKEARAGNVELMDDLGVIQMLLGKDTIAIHTLNKAIAAGSKEAFYPLGKLFLTQSQDARDENTRWNAAVNQLREATQVDPQNAGAWLHLGQALMGLVEEESLTQVSIAYEQYLNMGAPLGKTDEINQFLIGQDPERQRRDSVRIGQEALAEKDYQRSITAFEKAIQLGDKESFFFLGTAFEASGNFARALDAYQTAYGLGIRPQEVALRLGRTLVSLRTSDQVGQLAIEALKTQLDQRDKQAGASEERTELKKLYEKLLKMQKED